MRTFNFTPVNLKLGFATNSSSNHSIIFIDSMEEISKIVPDESNDSFCFGWEDFTLKTREDKKRYVDVMLMNIINNATGSNNLYEYAYDRKPKDDAYYAELKRRMEGYKKYNISSELYDANGEIVLEAYIDHDSEFTPPRKISDLNSFNMEFTKDFTDWLIDCDHAIILGGNDNGPEHELAANAAINQHFSRFGALFCRKEQDKVWTLFNNKTGARLTVDFDTSSKCQKNIILAESLNTYGDIELDTLYSLAEHRRLNRPLLLDIKITDFCNFGCAYCYQGSTPEGKHADIGYIESVAKTLKELEVFEVAVGGGETTTHPKFRDIVEIFAKNHLKVNFTTKNINWLSTNKAIELISINVNELPNEDDKEDISNFVIGGIAISCDSIDMLVKITNFVEFYNKLSKEVENKISKDNNKASSETDSIKSLPKAKSLRRLNTFLNLQVIVGAQSLEDTREILEFAMQEFIPVTFLGYKTTGRGCQFTPRFSGLELWNMLLTMKSSLRSIGIDTVLAAEIQKELISFGIPEFMYEIKDGTSSMYWDCVEKKIGPCSYSNQYIPMEIPSSDEVIKHFASF